MYSKRLDYTYLVLLLILLLSSKSICAVAPLSKPILTPPLPVHPGIELVGIIYSSTPRLRSAYLRINNALTEISVADRLDNGWKVKRILPDTVVLNKGINQVSFSLKFIDEKTDKSIELKRKLTSVKSRTLNSKFNEKLLRYINGRPVASVPFPFGVESHGVEQISEDEYLIEIPIVRKQLGEKNISDHINFEVNNGLEITEIVPGSLFDKAGIIPGDRIVSFNGQQTKNIGSILSSVRELLNSEKATLEFIRGDEKKVLKYNLIDNIQ